MLQAVLQTLLQAIPQTVWQAVPQTLLQAVPQRLLQAVPQTVLLCLCVSAVPPMLLVSNRFYIREVSVDGRQVALLEKELSNAVALDFLWDGPSGGRNSTVFWSDVTASGSRISSKRLDTGRKTTLHSATVRNPDGISVDWVANNLYWCDKTTDTIEVSMLDGRSRTVLVSSGLHDPRALAVNPYRGWLFYSDWGEKPHIGESMTSPASVTTFARPCPP